MRHLMLAVAGLIALSAAAGAQPRPGDTPEEREYWLDRFHTGKRAYEAGQIEKAVEHFGEALEATSDFEESDPRVGMTLAWLARSLMDLERWKDAEPHIRRLMRLPGDEPSHVEHRRDANRDLAVVLRFMGRLVQAKRQQQRYMKLLGTKAKPARMCEAIEGLAWIEIEREDDAHALRLLKLALGLREKRIGEDAAMAHVLHAIGQIHARAARESEAEPFLRRALAIREKVLDAGASDLAVSRGAVARIEMHRGRIDEAVTVFREILPVLERTLGQDHVITADVLRAFAEALWRRGLMEEAVAIARRALDATKKALGPEHRVVGYALELLANVQQNRGYLARALELRLRSLAIVEKHGGQKSFDAATAENNFGTIYRDLGRHEEAIPHFRRSIAQLEATLGKEHHYVAYPLTGLAMVLRSLDRLAEAETPCLRGISIRLKAFGPDHPSLAVSYRVLAEILRDAGRLAEAESTARRALEVAKPLGSDHARRGRILGVLASILCRTSKETNAFQLFVEGLAVQEKALGSDHWDLLPTLDEYAAALKSAGRDDIASGLVLRAAKIREKLRATADSTREK